MGPLRQIAHGLVGLAKQKLRSKPPAPGVTARISTDGGSKLTDVVSGLNWMPAAYPFEFLELARKLYRWDPNCKKHRITTLSLGNPGHELEIDAPTEARAREALQVCNDLAARCFPFAGGADGLINGQLDQIAAGGAAAMECEPDEGMQQIKRAWLFPLYTVRFRKTADGGIEIGQVQDGQFVPLNPVQTVYHAVWTEDSSPYPIPPVLAAIERITSHRRIMASIEDWFSKLAAMGFLSIIQERPNNDGESAEEYERKCATRLDALAKIVKDNLTKGIILGYDDMEVQFTNTSAGAAGAKQVGQMLAEDMFAGLGRDPVLFGRSFSRTETWASVAYEELEAEIRNIQHAPKRGLEHMYRLNFALGGMGDVGVSLQFHESRAKSGFLESEGSEITKNGIRADRESGLIDDDLARKLLGYDDAIAKAGKFIAAFNGRDNRYKALPFKPVQWPGAEMARQGRRDATEDARQGRRDATDARNEDWTPAFAGETGLENSVAEARRAAREYLFEVQSKLSGAAQIGVAAVYEWARQRDIPEEDAFVARAMRLFLGGAEDTLDAAALEKIGKKHLDAIWQWARYEDDALFGPDWDRGATGVGTVFGITDETAVRYMSRVDRFYVSKYISGDERTSRQIQDFLREQYLDKGLGRGKSPKELRAFRDAFSDLAERIGENRSRVIIDTGVSRAQNWGEAFALHDEEIVKFRIAGPWDRLTCNWCKAMRGHEWEVRREVERISNVIASGSEDISQFDKFITSRFAGKDGLKALQGMDTAAIQATGMVTPPIHPLCRHRLVAIVAAASNARPLEWALPVLASGWQYREAA